MDQYIFGRPNPAGAYAEKRLSTRCDDRCDRDKMWDDAALRGKMGVNAANKVIAMIDDYKSRNP